MSTHMEKTEDVCRALTAPASTADRRIDRATSDRYARALRVPLISLALSGCAQRAAPSFALFGAYFPAWMLCALLGVLAAIFARAGFVATGLSSALPYQLFVCIAIGACFALFVWLFWFA